jgi:transmembrane 9 superfamily protein 1
VCETYRDLMIMFYLARYSRDEEAADEQEETGWKYIHGDVFRYPAHKSLFCAVLGSGTQLLAL